MNETVKQTINIAAALSEIEKMEKTFKAFSEAKNALSVLAGMEQQTKEMSVAVEFLKAEKQALLEENKRAREDISFLNKEKEEIVKETKEEVSRVEEALMSSVHNKVNAFVKESEQKEMVSKDKVEKLEDKATILIDKILVLEKELYAVEKKLEDAKKAVERLLSGAK